MEAVVVTSNSAQDLEGLLDCAPLRASFDRLVVVDNGSTDASPRLAAAGGATVIRRGTRVGYGAALNVGIRETAGPLVAILNPDIRIRDTEDADRLAEAFADPEVGICAPALRLPDGSIQDSARRVPTPLELLLRRRLAPRRGAIHNRGAVPWVTAACMLVRREAFEAVNGFDDGYRLYFEDVDFCTRMRAAGWIVLYDPTVVMQHQHRAASRQNLFGWCTRTHARSAARFYRRNPRHLVSTGSGASPIARRDLSEITR